MTVYITGIGFITSSSMGCGRQSNDFGMEQGTLPELTRKMVFDNPYKPFGRMDRFSRIGLAGIAFALRDAGLNAWTSKRDIGIIASSVYGSLETDLNYYGTVIPDGGKRASPNLFAYTLSNCFLGETAIYYGLIGETTVINESKSGTTACLQTALDYLEFNQSDAMICGICDTEQPIPLDKVPLVVPGSLFFVLETQIRDNSLVYGTLDRDKKNRILFNEVEIDDLFDLTRKCLPQGT